MSEHAHEKKRGISGIWNKMYYLVLLCVLASLLLNQQNTGPKVIGGFGVFNVLTGSMQSEIPKGSLVVTRNMDKDSLQIGDDITFMAGPSTTITHRIVGIIEDYNNTGYRGFETKGLENLNKDKDIVEAPNIIGKVIFHNYTLGQIFEFVKAYWLQILIYMLVFVYIRKALMFILDRKSQGTVAVEENGECEPQGIDSEDYIDLEEHTKLEDVVESLQPIAQSEESKEESKESSEKQVERILEEIYEAEHEKLFQQHLEELKEKRTPWYKKLRSRLSGGEK